MSNPNYEIGKRVDWTHTLDVHSALRRGARGFRCAVSALSLPARVARDPVSSEAFARAAMVLARLQHPNLVAVEDVWESEGRAWAVVPPLAGTPLARMLGVPSSRARPIAASLASDVVLSVAEAAHSFGNAFGRRSLGGLSADSIWITREGSPVLLPTACLATRDASEDDAVARYRAPEGFRGEPLEASADVYALGLLLWDLLALGRARLPSDIDDATCATPPSSDKGIVHLVMRSLSVSPGDRPRSALEFHAELSRLAPPAHSPSDDNPTMDVHTVEILAGTDDEPALAVMPAPVRSVADPARPRVFEGVPVPRIRPTLGPVSVHAIGPGCKRFRVIGGNGASATSLLLDGPVRRWVVGRSRSADLVVCDPDMSREHFEVVEGTDGEYLVYDLGSKNGLFVNGSTRDQHALRFGDEVRAGETVLRFEA